MGPQVLGGACGLCDTSIRPPGLCVGKGAAFLLIWVYLVYGNEWAQLTQSGPSGGLAIHGQVCEEGNALVPQAPARDTGVRSTRELTIGLPSS